MAYFLRSYLARTVILLLVNCAVPVLTSQGESLVEYMKAREELLSMEKAQRTGGKIVLTEKEQKVNQTLMAMKEDEYNAGIQGEPFPPAMHFFHAKPLIDKSGVFDVIRMMPKGAALHIHDISVVNLSWVIAELTYLPNLYYCQWIPPSIFQGVRFSFFSQPPTHSMVNCSSWELVAYARNKTGNDPVFDMWMFQNLSMVTDDPQSAYPDTYKAWQKFGPCLTAVADLVYSTEKIFQSYVYQSLLEFYQDNVQYMEIRFTPKELNTTSGNKGSLSGTLQKYIDTVALFKKTYPDFYGAKFISQSIRIEDESAVLQDIKNAIQYKKTYPDHYAGYDLVAEEDTGFTLLHYIKALLLPSQANASLPFFFHAGETDWEGTPIDENLFDAILLNTTRIGHGYAITKHPVAMELARKKDIAIEVNPISNQVLGLVSDLRNHPAATLIAEDFPLVISSDDPSVWSALPLSHDFYQAFMGLGGKRADLATLKQLALNSIKYSATTTKEKAAMVPLWTSKWDTFLDQVLAKYGAKYLKQR